MKITRHNYEEYFILYMDNELGSDDRRQVELFVQENADLKEEFNWLLQSRFVPDDSVVFDEKEQLMKSGGVGSIDSTNYETWLLLYIDNELTAGEKEMVEKFVASHPSIQQEFELFQKSRLHPEKEIGFPNKELLYRREERVRVLVFNWKKIAVAAALIIVCAGALMVFNPEIEDNADPIASGNMQNSKKQSPAKATDDSFDVTTNTRSTDGANSNATANSETGELNNTLTKIDQKSVSVSERNNRSSVLPTKEKAPDVAAKNFEKEKTNDLPDPTNNPNVNSINRGDNPIAQVDILEKKPLTNPDENTVGRNVTPQGSQSLNNGLAFASTEPVDLTDEEQPGKKNKLRGFFRKVTRTFEKTTNIKATDDEDRLLLGGLAIKL